MDISPFLLLGFMWLVVNALRKAGSAPGGGKRPPPRPPSPPSTSPGPTGSAAPDLRSGGPVPAGTRRPGAPGADATQREGLRLEELMRELGRTLDQAAGTGSRAPDRGLPGGKQKEVESLEVAPVVRSLETVPVRPERSVVDQDDQAEAVVARRLRAGEAQWAPRTRADHRAFDARIRQEAPDKTATSAARGITVRQLRNAMVWREILGPPVSLREDDER